MRPLLALSLSLVLLPAWASSARADLVLETEPNDTFATANKTVGLNNLGFEGSFTLGDIDIFSMFITPNAQGMATFTFDAFWSAGSPNPPFNRWLVTRFTFSSGFGQSGFSQPTGNSASFTFPANVPGVYYLQLYSAMPLPPTSGPVPGSTVIGDYRLTNIRGLDGTIVRGTAVPEPTGILLGLALSGSGFYLKRRSKKGNR